MAKVRTDIAIIGGGLSGLVLALSLHRHGIKSTIYESRSRLDFAGGYIGLGPNALRVIHHLGLYNAVLEDAYTYEKLELMTSAGSVIGSFWTGSRVQGFPSIRVRRSKLRDVLLSAISKNRTEIVYGKELQKLSEVNDVVELVFGDGTVVTSSLVIGADGLRSTVRKAIAPETQPKEQLDQEALDFSIPSMILGPEGSFTVIPVDPPGNRLGFITTLQLPDRPMEEWQALWKDKDSLKAIMEGSFGKESWPKIVGALCRETVDDEVLAWPIFVLPDLARRTSASRKVILIGDAAHGMSPACGQGGAMGLEDGETLAWVLAHDSTSQKLLPRWAAHRQQRKIKEWVIWGLIWYHGEAGMSAWVSNYDGEKEMAALSMQ
ncbi:hypothetical protein OIDMADRAFT_58227 [Oidiodendron maius Zn]|uniref:FAD-binding domain-containing protein n=1 Tax=Oidiodendron maius (strain Zn) TaxID=913774 RepID=A0A0C3H2C4_OIDMZ|nr:hypothetical protein OIDMADRAFT_58227 [Oidiodendron maius Zn]